MVPSVAGSARRRGAGSWWLGFAGFEPGDRVGRGADDLGEQLLAVVDAEGGVGFLDGDCLAGVADPDLDLLPRDADAAAGADPPVHSQGSGHGVGVGPAGRAFGIRATWPGASGFGRVRLVSSRCSTLWSRRTVTRRPARW